MMSMMGQDYSVHPNAPRGDTGVTPSEEQVRQLSLVTFSSCLIVTRHQPLSPGQQERIVTGSTTGRILKLSL